MLLEVLEIKDKVQQVADAYRLFIVFANPHTLLSLAHGTGVGVKILGTDEVEVVLCHGPWNCRDPDLDDVDDYLETLIHTLPLSQPGSEFNLFGCVKWVKDNGISSLDLTAFTADFPKSKLERFVEALLFSNSDVIRVLKNEMLDEVDDAVQVLQDNWEFSLEESNFVAHSCGR
jgi:hypothetical protein